MVGGEHPKLNHGVGWEAFDAAARPTQRRNVVGSGTWIQPRERGRWQATLRHIALEGRCFVIGCKQFVTKEHYPADIEILGEMEDGPDVLCRGGTSMYSPLGEVVAGPLLDVEGMLVADLDMGDVARGKFDFDVIGHCARPDVFELRVNEEVGTAVGGAT